VFKELGGVSLLVKSASRPISNKEIKKQNERINTPEANLDKNGKPLKFSRDMESDWTIKNDKAHYGLKEHAPIDVNHGFILSTTLTPASFNNSISAILHYLHTADIQNSRWKRFMLIKVIL